MKNNSDRFFENDSIEQLWQWKLLGRDTCGIATVTLTADVSGCKDEKIEAGTTVLIWAVSRFGDIGITDNFKQKGYKTRVPPEWLKDVKIIKEPEKGWKEK